MTENNPKETSGLQITLTETGSTMCRDEGKTLSIVCIVGDIINE